MVEMLTLSVLFNVFLLYKLFDVASRNAKMMGLLFQISQGKVSIKCDENGVQIKNT
jgi:hypothetical protein